MGTYRPRPPTAAATPASPWPCRRDPFRAPPRRTAVDTAGVRLSGPSWLLSSPSLGFPSGKRNGDSQRPPQSLPARCRHMVGPGAPPSFSGNAPKPVTWGRPRGAVAPGPCLGQLTQTAGEGTRVPVSTAGPENGCRQTGHYHRCHYHRSPSALGPGPPWGSALWAGRWPAGGR